MKWPEKDIVYKDGELVEIDNKARVRNRALDQARQAVEETVSVEKIEKAIDNQRKLDLKKYEKKQISAFNLINEADLRNAQAIHKQIMDELFGGER